LAAKAAMFLVPVAMVLLSGVILGVGDCGGLSGILKFELFLHTPDTDASLILLAWALCEKSFSSLFALQQKWLNLKKFCLFFN
jgi:hypothetical protein